MRILFIVPYMELGGTERHVATLSTGLIDQFECETAVLAPDGPAIAQFFPRKTQFFNFPRLDRGLRSGLSGFHRAFRRAIESIVPDVIHIHAGAELLLLAMIELRLLEQKRLGQKPVASVFTVHGYHGPRTSIDYKFAALMGRLADRVVCVSGAEEQILLSAGLPPKKLLRIYNGVRDPLADPERERVLAELKQDYPELATSGKVIGTVARLEKPKGIDVLLRAFARLKSHSEFTGLKLAIVGSGSEETRLKSLVKELELPAEDLIFTGHDPRADHLSSLFDVFVLPSIQEPFGLVCAEAMANSRPVVASQTGGIPEIVANGTTGFVVAPGDAHQLSEKLAGLLKDPQLRSQMGRNGRERYERLFSDRSMVQNTYDCYSQILKQKKGNGWDERDG